jgi:hypothetical protein
VHRSPPAAPAGAAIIIEIDTTKRIIARCTDTFIHR